MESYIDRVNRMNAFLLARMMARPNVIVTVNVTVLFPELSDADDEHEWSSDEESWEGDISGGDNHNELSMFAMLIFFLCTCVLDTIV